MVAGDEPFVPRQGPEQRHKRMAHVVLTVHAHITQMVDMVLGLDEIPPTLEHVGIALGGIGELLPYPPLCPSSVHVGELVDILVPEMGITQDPDLPTHCRGYPIHPG